MTQNDEFLNKLQSAFNTEAEEHLQAIAAGLLDLEKPQDATLRRELLSSIFREAHSLKGAARAVNLPEIEGICQSLESIFAVWKRDEIEPAPALLDPLHHAVNVLAKLLPSSRSPRTDLNKDEISNLLTELGVLGGSAPNRSSPAGVDLSADERSQGDVAEPIALEPMPALPAEGNAPKSRAAASSERKPPHSKPLSETLRISTAKLDALLLKAEELLTVKLTVNQRASELQSVAAMLGVWEKEWRKVTSDRLPIRKPAADDLRNLADSPGRATGEGSFGPELAGRLLEFLEWNQSLIRSVQERLGAVAKSADHDRRSTAGMVDSLLEDAKKLLMLPFSTLLAVFPKLVRDLSRDEGKDVDLVIRGAEVEIDKRILEEMKDPLIHLVRNCIDHGIEKPAIRAAAKKPIRGTINIAISQVDGNKVEILISDDGAGIDPRAVRVAAVEHGSVSAADAQKLADPEAIRLVFEPEVSTSPIITEISGRGLGLAIVREKVEKLGGRIEVETVIGGGTSFRLVLPPALATFRGILVQSAGQVYVIPTANVDRVTRIKAEEVQTVENRETIRLDERTVCLVRLDDVLGLPRSPRQQEVGYMSVVVLGVGEKRIGFRIDAVLNEQEVLVKPLARPLSRVRNVAGATVLGSGKAVPILNIADLMKSAVNWKPAGIASGEPAGSEGARGKSILVVEDSITARMLIKNILESAGYLVKTAVDGVDGFTMLRSDKFDLVVSDVEMPRMNGFDLTSHIRADKRLAELPVVLVTALASQGDRERGVDAGANAYIVKSSFDQSNLLDVVRRLV